MSKLFESIKRQIRKSIERDKALENRVGVIAQKMWPWSARWLSTLVVIIALLDFGSTYLLLEFSGNMFAYESGLLAGWALRLGGMRWLLLIDLLAACSIISLAFSLRYLFSKRGFPGYGKAFFVVLQLPYIIVTAAAIINNILLTYLA